MKEHEEMQNELMEIAPYVKIVKQLAVEKESAEESIANTEVMH